MRDIRFLFAGILLSLLVSCSGLESIEVGEIEDVNFSRLAGRAIEFEVLMPIDNPSSLRLRIIDVDLDVYINDEYIGKISNVDNVLIPARSDELYTFPLRVEFSSILQGAISMYNFFLDRQTEIYLKGNISVRSFPFTRKISVEEKTYVRMK